MKDHCRQFKSFRQFWPFYVSQHNNLINRRLHVGGTLCALLLGAFLFSRGSWILALTLCPVVGYGCAWFGHFFFEKNRPATFRFPIYSFMGDFKLIYCVLTGRRLL